MREQTKFHLSGMGKALTLTDVSYDEAVRWASNAVGDDLIGKIHVNACADAGINFQVDCDYPGIGKVRMLLSRAEVA